MRRVRGTPEPTLVSYYFFLFFIHESDFVDTTVSFLLIFPSGYIAICVFYNLIFAVCSLFKSRGSIKDHFHPAHIALLIPGYKEDNVIVKVAQCALRHDYPRAFFDVIVIADSFQKKTLDELRSLPVKLIEVSFSESTKAKSLNAAMKTLVGSYDLAVVLDADNIMENGVLDKMSQAFRSGHKAIQCHRTAKNSSNVVSRLDGLSEEIGNSILRKGHNVLGLSSDIAGSGFGCQFDLYREAMQGINGISEDKSLEIELLRRQVNIHYLFDAVVYDEKVQNQKHLLIQRSRWFSAHYQFAFKYFLIGWQKFFSEWNIDLLNKTIQHTLLPRSMTFVAILILAFFAVLTGNFTLLVGASVMFSLMTLAMALATPKKFYTIDTLHAMAYLPFTLVTLIHAALIAKPSQKAFDHTPHHDLDTDHQ